MNTQDLWKRYSRRKTVNVKKELVLSYLNLVKFSARAIVLPARCVFDSGDLVSFGIIGLNEAIERFDPGRGVKFETFASQRIRGVMLDELRKVDWLPRSVRDKYKKASKSLNELDTDKADGDEYARAMNMSVREFDQIKGYVRNAEAVSLNKGVGDDMTLEDVLAGDCEVVQEFEDTELKGRLANLLRELPQRDRMVITLYYYEDLTFKQIGKVLHVSESRVSQIHSDVIGRLRESISEKAVA